MCEHAGLAMTASGLNDHRIRIDSCPEWRAPRPDEQLNPGNQAKTTGLLDAGDSADPLALRAKKLQ